jgi:8-oxo-dGTP diphosphatase
VNATVRAAGGVLWRPTGGGVEVALVHRPRYDDWSLPKGKLNPGEHPVAAAGREVLEETGVAPALGPRLPTVRYEVPTPSGPAPKLVDYWAARADSSGDAFVPNNEVDQVRWLPPDEASALLTHAHDRPVLAAFAALPPVTGVVLLIRHGKAGSRDEWTGDDRIRPLDAEGQAQATRLALMLPWFAPTRILSADRARCIQTMEPVAAALSLRIEVDADLDDERHEEDPGRIARKLRAQVAGGGVLAVSSQGGAIPETVAILAAGDGFPVDEVASDKGSLWVLSFHGATLVAADYLPGQTP